MKNKKLFLTLIVAVVGLAGILLYTRDCDADCQADKNTSTPAVNSFGTLTPELFQERIAASVVLDVRTPEEYTQGHIEDAVLIDFYADDFKSQLKELDKTVNYSIYCKSGNRSSSALETMEDLGFKNVYELSGGITAWQAAGLPVVQ